MALIIRNTRRPIWRTCQECVLDCDNTCVDAYEPPCHGLCRCCEDKDCPCWEEEKETHVMNEHTMKFSVGRLIFVCNEGHEEIPTADELERLMPEFKQFDGMDAVLKVYDPDQPRQKNLLGGYAR